MPQLIVMMDPVQPTQVYKVIDDETMTLERIFKLPQESLSFIQDFAREQHQDTLVSFLGPESYVEGLIEKANQLEFVKASSTTGGMKRVKISD
jgi:hypothetical protein